MAAEARPDIVSVCLPVSDLHIERRLRRTRDWILRRVAEIGAVLRTLGLRGSLGLEDATRAEPDFVERAASVAEASGFERVRFADTVGIGTPLSIARMVAAVREAVSIEIAVHAHNDFRMATATAIPALQSGADWVDVSALGTGERVGIARLEELAAYLSELCARNGRRALASSARHEVRLRRGQERTCGRGDRRSRGRPECDHGALARS